jgi:hypothetical protein
MRSLLLAAPILLAACGDVPSVPNPFSRDDSAPATGAALPTRIGDLDYGNRYSAGLARKAPEARASTLAQAVQSTNRRCPIVTRTAFKGSFEHKAFWAVDCSGSDYLVAIAGDGTLSAETCSVQGTVGPGCWVEW